MDKVANAVRFLDEAARYFETRPTGDEDLAHWANVYNAENCRKTIALIENLSSTLEVTERLRLAACEFIDSHVADPDITSEMVENYERFQRTRAAFGKHFRPDHLSTPNREVSDA